MDQDTVNTLTNLRELSTLVTLLALMVLVGVGPDRAGRSIAWTGVVAATLGVVLHIVLWAGA